jgi:hypothetical protein
MYGYDRRKSVVLKNEQFSTSSSLNKNINWRIVMKLGWKILSVLALFGLLFGLAATPALAKAEQPGKFCDPNSFFVMVKHGINGERLGLPSELPVDVYINGELAISGFEFRDSLKTMMPAGEYDISVTLAGTDTEVMSLSADIPGCNKVSIVARLVKGTPTLVAKVISLAGR